MQISCEIRVIERNNLKRFTNIQLYELSADISEVSYTSSRANNSYMTMEKLYVSHFCISFVVLALEHGHNFSGAV